MPSLRRVDGVLDCALEDDYDDDAMMIMIQAKNPTHMLQVNRQTAIAVISIAVNSIQSCPNTLPDISSFINLLTFLLRDLVRNDISIM